MKKLDGLNIWECWNLSPSAVILFLSVWIWFYSNLIVATRSNHRIQTFLFCYFHSCCLVTLFLIFFAIFSSFNVKINAAWNCFFPACLSTTNTLISGDFSASRLPWLPVKCQWAGFSGCRIVCIDRLWQKWERVWFMKLPAVVLLLLSYHMMPQENLQQILLTDPGLRPFEQRRSRRLRQGADEAVGQPADHSAVALTGEDVPRRSELWRHQLRYEVDAEEENFTHRLKAPQDSSQQLFSL